MVGGGCGGAGSGLVGRLSPPRVVHVTTTWVVLYDRLIGRHDLRKGDERNFHDLDWSSRPGGPELFYRQRASEVSKSRRRWVGNDFSSMAHSEGQLLK